MSISKFAAANTTAVIAAGSKYIESVDNIIAWIMAAISLAFYTLTFIEKKRHHKVLEKRK